MKLLSCYIANFGCLHDFSCDFSDGVAVFCHENGWGKSTFCAFLRVMLYGFSGGRKRDVTNERAFYRPWQGGTYGGNLVFETAEGTWRIERSFAEREKNDTFDLYDLRSRQKSTRYSSSLGQELFGLDAAAFCRCAFLSQTNSLPAGTDGIGGIRAILAGLVEAVDDLDTFDSAMEALEKKQKDYKKTGDRGLLPEIGRQIAACERQAEESRLAADAEREQLSLADEQKRLLTETEESLRKNEAELAQVALRREACVFAELTQTAEKDRARAKELRDFFRGDLPDAAELTAVAESLSGADIAQAELRRVMPTAAEQEQAGQTVAQFDGRMPDEEVLSACIGKSRQMDALRARGDAAMPDDATLARYADLKRRFLSGVPSEEQLSAAERQVQMLSVAEEGIIAAERSVPCREAEDRETEARIDTCEELFARLPALRQKAEQASAACERAQTQEPLPGKYLPFAFFGGTLLFGTLLIIGALLHNWMLVLIGILLSAGCAVPAVVSTVRLQKRKEKAKMQADTMAYAQRGAKDALQTATEAANEALSALHCACYEDFAAMRATRAHNAAVREGAERQIAEYRARAKSYTEQLQSFLSTYDALPTDQDYGNAVRRLRTQVRAYTDAEAAMQQAADRQKALDAQIAALESEIADAVGIFVDSTDQLIRLRDACRSAAEVLKRRDQAQGITLRRDACLTRVATFLARWYDRTAEHRTGADLLEEIRTKCRQWKEAERRIADNDAAQTAYLAEHPALQAYLAGHPEPESAQSLAATADSLQSQRALLQTQRESCMRERLEALHRAQGFAEQASRLPELQAQLVSLREQKESYEKRLYAAQRAEELLRQAKDNLSCRYLRKMEESFSAQMSELSGVAVQCEMNEDFSVSYMVDGRSRPVSYFSRGIQDLTGFCLRVALCDAVFDAERPPLFLDDPFVNLDDTRQRVARSFLERLSDRYQILYFCCSQTRESGAF